jgi:CRISPR/Cas system-associated exonuclease Cas4 (RecB family)
MPRNSLKNVARLVNAVNEELPIEQQFLQDLKTSIEKANNEPYKPSQTIKPSSFNCIRNAYYQLIGVEPEEAKNTYNLAGICESGTDRHIRMQQNIERMKEVLGVDCEYINVAEFIKQRNLTDLEIKGQSGMETKLYNKKYNMSFMCDGIVRYKGKYFIFEFKTESSNKFYQRKGVDESHYNQAISYSLNFGLDKVLFVYENRDVLDLKAYIFEVTDEMRRNLVDKIKVALISAESKRVPPKPLDVLKKTCSYCAYKTQCGKDI